MSEPRTAALLAALDMLHHYAFKGRRTASEARAIDGAHAAIKRAIEAEAAAPTPAEPLDLMRLAVEKGCPPDALMDSSPAGQNLRNWWLNDWAPVRERMRDYLDRLAAARPGAAQEDERP